MKQTEAEVFPCFSVCFRRFFLSQSGKLSVKRNFKLQIFMPSTIVVNKRNSALVNRKEQTKEIFSNSHLSTRTNKFWRSSKVISGTLIFTLRKVCFFLVTKVAQLAFHDLKIFTSHRWKTSGSFYESARKDNKFKREDEIKKLKNSHNNRLIKSAESAPPSSAIKEIKRCGILRVSKFI